MVFPPSSGRTCIVVLDTPSLTGSLLLYQDLARRLCTHRLTWRDGYKMIQNSERVCWRSGFWTLAALGRFFFFTLALLPTTEYTSSRLLHIVTLVEIVELRRLPHGCGSCFSVLSFILLVGVVFLSSFRLPISFLFSPCLRLLFYTFCVSFSDIRCRIWNRTRTSWIIYYLSFLQVSVYSVFYGKIRDTERFLFKPWRFRFAQAQRQDCYRIIYCLEEYISWSSTRRGTVDVELSTCRLLTWWRKENAQAIVKQKLIHHFLTLRFSYP